MLEWHLKPVTIGYNLRHEPNTALEIFPPAIKRGARAKRKERGGFEGRTWLQI
jgi:hypothetical protein